MKPAAELNQFGQSAWLDLIGRKLIRSGGLAKMVDEDGIRGVTANPAIFEKAIAESDEYDEELAQLIERGKTPLEIYDALIIGDVQTACDALRPLFDRVQGADGFVSLEVSPAIARDTAGTVEEAKRYWAAVDRPNLFIKIPANPQGIDAIRQATAAGISVNITLIFSNTVYAKVIDAYLSGLEERVAKGLPISQIHSVASFFVSRVDTAVDKRLPEGSPLRGKIAVANAKIAYQVFKESIASPRWKALEAKGATRQRPLWASTGTKNKAYSDVLYVETLIGRDTVNTLPLATLKAFNDHGKVADTVEQGVDEARAQLKDLAAAGIDLEEVCDTLTEEGLDLFSKALTSLLNTIEGRSLAQRGARESRLLEKPGSSARAFEQALEAAAEKKAGSRLWAKDPKLGVAPLGFLDIGGKLRHDAPELASFAREAAERFRHCVILADDGAAAGADALLRIPGKREGGLDLRVLDSAAPDAVRDAIKGFELPRTLFLVTSASRQVLAFYRYFRGEVEKAGGGNIAAPQQDAPAATPYGSHFVAIAEEGSELQRLARREGFWRTWVNLPDLGSRTSALGFPGLVPAALLGLDAGKLLEAASQIALASGASVPLKENLAVRLGALIAGCAQAKTDKLTFLLSPQLLPLGGWLSQLFGGVAALAPVHGEPTGRTYGSDRLFISLSLAGEPHDAAFLAEAGHPLVQWKIASPDALFGELLRFSIAAAIAGALLEINPFAPREEPGADDSLAEPALRGGGFALFAPHAEVLKKAAATIGGGESPAHWVAAHLALADAGADLIELRGQLPPADELAKELRTVQGRVRDATGAACNLAFGRRQPPRPGSVLLQLSTAGGAPLSDFAALFAARGRADFNAHGDRALRVHAEDGDGQKLLALLDQAIRLLRV